MATWEKDSLEKGMQDFFFFFLRQDIFRGYFFSL